MSPRITVLEIADIALKLCQLDRDNPGNANFDDPKKTFREYFAFCFDLLVDAELQLQRLREKPPEKEVNAEKRNVARP